MEDLASIERRATRIKLLLMDCDGVLTDGKVMLLENGDEQKTFNVRDGLGIVLTSSRFAFRNHLRPHFEFCAATRFGVGDGNGVCAAG